MTNMKKPKWAIYQNGSIIHKHSPKIGLFEKGIDSVLEQVNYVPFTPHTLEENIRTRPQTRQLRIGEYVSYHEVRNSHFFIPSGATLVPDAHTNGYIVAQLSANSPFVDPIFRREAVEETPSLFNTVRRWIGL